MPGAPSPPAPAWRDYDGLNHGHPLHARFDTALSQWPGRATHPVEVRVIVTLDEVTDDQLPTDAEAALLAPFEELVVALARAHAVVAGTITTEGLRVHALYARSAHWLEAFQRSLRQRLPTRRVTVKAGIDPKWTLYDTFVGRT